MELFKAAHLDLSPFYVFVQAASPKLNS